MPSEYWSKIIWGSSGGANRIHSFNTHKVLLSTLPKFRLGVGILCFFGPFSAGGVPESCETIFQKGFFSMSFMFKPLAYDDHNAVNHPNIPTSVREDITFGTVKAAQRIAAKTVELLKDSPAGRVVAVDGYASAKFEALCGALAQSVQQEGYCVLLRSVNDIYLPAEILDKMLEKNLPKNYDEDPVLLFGKLFDGNFTDFLDREKTQNLLEEMAALPEKTLMILSGYGCTSEAFSKSEDLKVYIDVTPKMTAIRVRNGQLINIGDKTPRSFEELMRRNYFVDFEVILKNRKRLLEQNEIDFYLCGDHDDDFILMTGKDLNDILLCLSCYPFRAKPVYLEGIWGGEFIRKMRKLPAEYKNIAWVFDMIPLEVSIVVDVDGHEVEFPFFTFIQKCPVQIMGKKCTDRFGGYFPIRFNYDDTYHSNGNMSIQVHPYESVCQERYNELGSQDEAYYVIATGHDAKTYLGFNEGVNAKEFVELAKKSEKDGSMIDYAKYVNHIDSTPGLQVMIPGGTIHASGRNQFILELGSLTVGSYTYKMYDYNRRDTDGNFRPIHIAMGEKVLHPERTTSWVRKNIAIDPIPDGAGDGWKQYIIGDTDLMYYQTKQLYLEKKAEFSNNGQFTVLTLVDGEEVKVYSRTHPEFCYHQKFLDVVVVPASITDYVIENIGYQPAVVHKTLLKTDG